MPTHTPTATPTRTPTPTPTPTAAPACGTLSSVTGEQATPAFAAAVPAALGTPQAKNYKMTMLPSDADLTKLDGVYPVPNDPSLTIITTENGTIWSVCLYSDRTRSLVGDLTDVVRDLRGSTETDEGLLGFAFQPGDPSYVYLNYSTPPDSVSPTPVYGYSPGPNVVHNHIAGFDIVNGEIDRGSEQTILDVYQPWTWHNAEGLLFGPDGKLYIGSGDGGASSSKGQTLNDLYGAILRIEVSPNVAGYTIPTDNPFYASPTTAAKEVWAYGLRNPWRFTFDSQTGMWMADVGEITYEEVNIGAEGANYGWNIMEGYDCAPPAAGTPTPGPTCNKTGLATPRAGYTHSFGCAITGGQVYRGSAMPELYGYFVYGDFCSGRVWALNTADPNSDPILLIDKASGPSLFHPTSWAITSQGEVVTVNYTRLPTFPGTPGIYELKRLDQ